MTTSFFRVINVFGGLYSYDVSAMKSYERRQMNSITELLDLEDSEMGYHHLPL